MDYGGKPLKILEKLEEQEVWKKSTGCPRFSTLAGRLGFFHSRCGEYFVGIVENLGENVEIETAVLRRYLVELMLVIIAFTVSA